MIDQGQKVSLRRALLGFLLAPLSPIIPLVALAVLTGGSGIGFWFMIILPISYGSSLILGLPVFLIFNYFGLNKLYYYVIAGALAAAIPIFYVFFYNQIFNGTDGSVFDGILPVHYKIMATMIVASVMVAATFWIIARPDKASVR